MNMKREKKYYFMNCLLNVFQIWLSFFKNIFISDLKFNKATLVIKKEGLLSIMQSRQWLKQLLLKERTPQIRTFIPTDCTV